MDVQNFNKLLKLHYYDKDARYELNLYCLAIIRRRLFFRGEAENMESLSHSILEYFLLHLPKKYVFAPRRYLNKSTDNYLSNLKKKTDRETVITQDIGYEQYFENIEKSELYYKLVGILGELNAKIVYLHFIEDVKEYDIAERLGIKMSYEAVRQRISRSKEILKIKLGKDVTKGE